MYLWPPPCPMGEMSAALGNGRGLKPTENSPLLTTRVINLCQEDHGRQGLLIKHQQEGAV